MSLKNCRNQWIRVSESQQEVLIISKQIILLKKCECNYYCILLWNWIHSSHHLIGGFLRNFVQENMRPGVAHNVSFNVCSLIHMVYFLTNQILNPLDVDFLELYSTSTKNPLNPYISNQNFFHIFRRYVLLLLLYILFLFDIRVKFDIFLHKRFLFSTRELPA